MKRFESFIYGFGVIFYGSAILCGIYFMLSLYVSRFEELSKEKFIEVDKAAIEVVDGIEELHLAVEMDLLDLEKQYEG